MFWLVGCSVVWAAKIQIEQRKVSFSSRFSTKNDKFFWFTKNLYLLFILNSTGYECREK